ncbi:MAG: HAD family hydrolase [archaeon]
MTDHIALVYDLDHTLTTAYQQTALFQDHLVNLQQEYGKRRITKPDDYWKLVSKRVDLGIGYMEQILNDIQNNIFAGITNEVLEKEYGPRLELAPGLPDFFERINEFCKQEGIKVDHHIVSVGLKPIIQGSKLAPYMKSIHASEFEEDKEGNITGFKHVLGPTKKPNVVKDICRGKGSDFKPFHEYDIFHRDILAFGDGQSDIEMFTYLKSRGATCFGVYPIGSSESYAKAHGNLGRCINILVPRDYREKSDLERFVKKAILQKRDRECIDINPNMMHRYRYGKVFPSEAQLIENHLRTNCPECKIEEELLAVPPRYTDKEDPLYHVKRNGFS